MAEGTVSIEDLENSPEFQALVVAATGKLERVMGDSTIPAEPPAWGDVRKQAAALLTEPPHVAVLAYMIKGEANVSGFTGFKNAIAVTSELLERHWDNARPAPDEDDPDDPYYARVNLLRELTDDPSFIDTVYRIPLVDVRGIGAFSTRDIDIARSQIEASDEERTRCQEGLIRGALAETDPEALNATVDAIKKSAEHCGQIEALFVDRAGPDNGLSFQSLQQMITGCEQKLVEFAGDLLAPSADDIEFSSTAAAGEQTSPSVSEITGASGRSSNLTSRTSVVLALDQLILFYQQNEPSSPVPIFAQRARDMVPKSFFDILQELSPQQHENFSSILEALNGNPLAHLINDSYRRYLVGERLDTPPVSVAGEPKLESDDTEIVHTSQEHVDNVRDSSADVVLIAEPEPSDLSGSGNSVNAVKSRAEVLELLSDIELFFNQNEPASPIPLIVAEMKKLVNKNFIELLGEFERSLPKSATAVEAPADE